MGLDLEYINGQTPLDEDEKEGLLIPTIATREELDEFEQQNIEQAIQWLLGRSLKAERVLDIKFICNLHKRMFDNVWAWAGEFRKTNKNLGIDHWEIPMALKSLCDDALFWVENGSYPPEEIAVRFKHRIVSIHCFPNGNGRHSRLMGDVIIEKIFGQPLFSWGASDIIKDGGARTSYLKALREANKNSYESLLKFAQS
jgi:Fic-DOC domain mobile mystery protein B